MPSENKKCIKNAEIIELIKNILANCLLVKKSIKAITKFITITNGTKSKIPIETLVSGSICFTQIQIIKKSKIVRTTILINIFIFIFFRKVEFGLVSNCS